MGKQIIGHGESMTLKQMHLFYQPDVKYHTRVSRYYNTGDPTYRPKPRVNLKKICPDYIPYGCFNMRVRLRGLEKALDMPYKGYHRTRKITKVKKVKKSLKISCNS